MVLDMGTAKIESLSETLKHTPTSRPALRAKIAAQIPRAREGRGSATRGWAGRAPKPGKERAELYEECGPEAFLLPNRTSPGASKFPVVARVVKGKPRAQQCAVDCGGAGAALVRARQHGYAHVANAAVEVLEKKCPASARARATRAKVSAAAKKVSAAKRGAAAGKKKVGAARAGKARRVSAAAA